MSKIVSLIGWFSRSVAIMAVGLVGGLMLFASGSQAAAPPPGEIVEIRSDGLAPTDAEVRVGARVRWHNKTVLPRRVVEEDVEMFRSGVLMPETGSDTLWPGADTFEYAMRFAGTFRYRVETALQATADELDVLQGTLAVSPVFGGRKAAPDGSLLGLFEWATFGVPQGWTYDVQYFGDDLRWELLHEGAEHGSEWLPIKCNDQLYAVKVRLHSPDGGVSDWSPPGGTSCHQDPPPF